LSWFLEIPFSLFCSLFLPSTVVYNPSIDPVVTSTPGIGTKEKPIATGNVSGSSNTAAKSTGFILPERKQKEYQTANISND
jgi:hypothetical protein